MRLLYAPGLSESVAKIEALRPCIKGRMHATYELGVEGALRQYAVRAGNLGGIVVIFVDEDEDEDGFNWQTNLKGQAQNSGISNAKQQSWAWHQGPQSKKKGQERHPFSLHHLHIFCDLPPTKHCASHSSKSSSDEFALLLFSSGVCCEKLLIAHCINSYSGRRITMVSFDGGRRRIFIFLSAIGAVILFLNLTLLTGTDVRSKIENIPIHIPLTDKKPESDAPPVEPEVGLKPIKILFSTNVEQSCLHQIHGPWTAIISKTMPESMISIRSQAT